MPGGDRDETTRIVVPDRRYRTPPGGRLGRERDTVAGAQHHTVVTAARMRRSSGHRCHGDAHAAHGNRARKSPVPGHAAERTGAGTREPASPCPYAFEALAAAFIDFLNSRTSCNVCSSTTSAIERRAPSSP